MDDKQITDERMSLPSASGGERLMMCPGSVQAEAQFQPLPENDIAAEGSAIAKAMETGDTTGLDDDQIDIVRHLTEIEAMALVEWGRVQNVPPEKSVIHREVRLWHRDHELRPVASAKLDFLATYDNCALVIDHKTGYLDVTPSGENWQLRMQAICVYSQWPHIDHIRVAIAHHRLRSKYDPCDYGPEDVEMSLAEMKRGLWRAKQPDAPRIPGPWCKYCRAKGQCPENTALTLLPVAMAGQPTVPMKGDALKTEIMGRVALLPREALLFLWERSSLIEGTLEAVKARLKQLPDAELKALGIERKEGAAVREVTDPAAMFTILLNEGLITQPEFQACCKVVLGRVEDTLKKRLAAKWDTTQEKALFRLNQIVAPTITLKPKAPSLVKIKKL